MVRRTIRVIAVGVALFLVINYVVSTVSPITSADDAAATLLPAGASQRLTEIGGE